MGSEESHVSKASRRLHRDLSQLSIALRESSWGESLFYYVDLMDRFYSSENSANSQSIPGYPLAATNGDVSLDDQAEYQPKDVNDLSLTVSNHGYLGAASGSIYRGFAKLARMDPWILSADELMALIRSLTDDILSFLPALADDILKR